MGNTNLSELELYNLKKQGEKIDELLNKMEGVEAGSNYYEHPTGDGNLHVPSSNNKPDGHVLMVHTGLPAWGKIQRGDVEGLDEAINLAEEEAIAHANGLLAANDALVFKGLLQNEGSNFYDLLFKNIWLTGWTWRAKEPLALMVDTSTTSNFVVVRLEFGDMLMAIKDHPEVSLVADFYTNTQNMTNEEIKSLFDEYFAVLQVNIDGAVISEETTSEDDDIVVFSGTKGRLIKSSGKKVSDFEPIKNKNKPNGYAGLDGSGKVPDAHLPITRERTLFSNALKGTASSAVIALSDVSPVEHEVECVVRSENALSYPFVSSAKCTEGILTSNGITFTDNGDGSIAVNGENDGTATSAFHIFSQTAPFSVAVGTYLTFTKLVDENCGVMLQVSRRLSDGTWKWAFNVTTEDVTIVTDSDAYTIYIVVSAGAAIDNVTLYPMLSLGSEAKPWKPPVAPETVTISRHGKNLIKHPYNKTNYEQNGIVFTENKDKSITMNGTATDNASFSFCTQLNPLIIPTGTTITFKKITQTDIGIRLDFQEKQPDGSWKWIGYARENDKPYTTTTGILYFYLIVPSGTTVDNLTIYPQVELGGISNEWEAPISPVGYTPSADGTVEGITSITPNLTLIPDTDGVVIDCKYNRDLCPELENIHSELEALKADVIFPSSSTEGALQINVGTREVVFLDNDSVCCIREPINAYVGWSCVLNFAACTDASSFDLAIWDNDTGTHLNLGADMPIRPNPGKIYKLTKVKSEVNPLRFAFRELTLEEI